MISKNICGFTTLNGKPCKCYKMKDAKFCKSHEQYDSGSDSEYDSDSDSDYDPGNDSEYEHTSDSNSIDITNSLHSEHSKRLDELERFARAYEKMEKDVSVMKAKMRQHNFIQIIVYMYLSTVFLYNNVQSEDIHLIVNDLTNYANMFATYSMVFVKDTQSLINNYYNHKVCFQ
jgi:ribosome-associated translation inhibitor RaiA